MPISNERLESLLVRIGCSFNFDAERNWFCGSLPTKVFRNGASENRVVLLASLIEDGEFLRLLAPEVYDLSSTTNRARVCEAAMQVAWQAKALAFELDGASGKLWAAIEFPLADGEITARQLERCVLLMLRLLDHYDPVLMHALTTGEVDLARAGRVEAPDAQANEIERLIQQLGGIEKVKAMASELPNAS